MKKAPLHSIGLYLLIVMAHGMGPGVPLAAEETGPAMTEHEEGVIPSVIYLQDRPEYPVWVASEVAFDEQGRPDPTYFREYDAIALRNFAKIEPNPTTGCIDLENFYVDYAAEPDRYNLEQAIESSSLVLVGKVVAAHTGISWETPGTLYAIELEEILAGHSERDVFYVPFPRGEMMMGPHRLCKTDSNYAESPELGDSVLVMLYQYPNPAESFLRPRFDTSLITLKVDGAVRLPSVRFPEQRAHLKDSTNQRTELMARVRGIVDRPEVP